MGEDTLSSLLLRPGVSRIFSIMAARQRRQILCALHAGWVDHEADVMTRGSKNEEDEAEIPLHHIHLPELAEAGFIEWDPDTGEISKGPRFGEIEPLLELIEDHSDELPPDWP